MSTLLVNFTIVDGEHEYRLRDIYFSGKDEVSVKQLKRDNNFTPNDTREITDIVCNIIPVEDYKTLSNYLPSIQLIRKSKNRKDTK